MRKTILTAVAALSMLGAIDARTWTSADGTKTFDATYVSHDDEYVTVSKSFKERKFKISLLSEADREWLASQKADKEEAVSEAPDLGKVGEKLKGNMVMLKNGAYQSYEAETAPEYYIIYYTASW